MHKLGTTSVTRTWVPGMDSGQADINGLLMQSLHLQDRLSLWIKSNVSPASRTYPSTSYGLKHLFSSDCQAYVNNDVFKAAMLLQGYAPVDPRELNWRYRIKVRERRATWCALERVGFLWSENAANTEQQLDNLLTYWSDLLVHNTASVRAAEQVSRYTRALELWRGKEMTYPATYPIDMRHKARILCELLYAEGAYVA